MARLKLRSVPFRRKRTQKTHYPKRISMLISGIPRVVVRFTNQKIIAQIIEYHRIGDKVIVAVDSFALRAVGWPYSAKNFPAAYLTGLLLGRKAIAKGCSKAILDTGFKVSLKKGKTYAVLKGLLDGGLDVPHGEAEIFPTPERIRGDHIKAYAQKLGKTSGTQFSKYTATKVDPGVVTSIFDQVKEKIKHMTIP